MAGLINTIPLILLVGGVAWYLYEQDKKISTIKYHTFFTLNAVKLGDKLALRSHKHGRESGQ